MQKVAFHTFGCKLNQLETESIADSFRHWEFVIVPSGSTADLIIVNSCTVTSKSEQKARRFIRQALADNPSASVIVTGCYAQVEPEGVAALDPRVSLVSLERKDALLDLPRFLKERHADAVDLASALVEWKAGASAGYSEGNSGRRRAGYSEGNGGRRRAGYSEGNGGRFAFAPSEFSFHSRAFLKIQDGCDGACAYCLVRVARGPSSSLAATEAVARIKKLEDAGYAEAVLTGVNISRYRDGRLGFPELLSAILEGTSRIRLRLSSYEPEAVDGRFVRAVAHERVCPHFHLAVQSGSDAILKAMNRPYPSGAIREAVEALRVAKDDPFLACDVIAGFPGETDEDFKATLSLLRDIDFAWIHAFPFSPRPGTPAFSMPGHVREAVVGERIGKLTALARSGKAAYAARWVGRETWGILERRGHAPTDDTEADLPKSGAVPVIQKETAGSQFPRLAVSDNYLKVALRENPVAAGKLVRILIENSWSGRHADATGRIVG